MVQFEWGLSNVVVYGMCAGGHNGSQMQKAVTLGSKQLCSLLPIALAGQNGPFVHLRIFLSDIFTYIASAYNLYFITVNVIPQAMIR